uniref:Lfe121p8 n=1 Tax=Leptospirillum ferrooxidans TaxID=180 RepID=Q7X1K4_9BACT|nr:Lfe121p8 [Leptospirillum ferrooxidans]
MAGQRLIPEDRHLLIRTRIPSRDLDDRALVARLKNTKGSKTTYEDFLVARQGKSSIDRETFFLYMEEVLPDPGVMEEWILFSPTHRDRAGLLYMMIEGTEKTHRLIREDGVKGSCSKDEFPDFFSTI